MYKKFSMFIVAIIFALSTFFPVFSEEQEHPFMLTLQYLNDGSQGTACIYAEIPMTDEVYDTITSMILYYSYDGDIFMPLIDTFGEETDICFGGWAQDGLFTTVCLSPLDEPLYQFLRGTVDRFWIKVKVNCGTYAEFTNAYEIKKDLEERPLPDTYIASTMFPENMVSVERTPDGKLVYTANQKITMKRGTTNQELLSHLPETIEMYIQVMEAESHDYKGKTTAPFKIKWTTPENLSDLPAGTYVVRQDHAPAPAAEQSKIEICLNTYTFMPNLCNDPLNLIITVIESDPPPSTVLPPEEKEDEDDLTSGSGGNRGNTGNDNTGNGGIRDEVPSDNGEDSIKLTEPNNKQPDAPLNAIELPTAAPSAVPAQKNPAPDQSYSNSEKDSAAVKPMAEIGGATPQPQRNKNHSASYIILICAAGVILAGTVTLWIYRKSAICRK